MGDRTNYHRKLWKATFKWSQHSLIVLLSLLLFAESGLSLPKDQVKNPSSVLTQGKPDEAHRLSAEAWQLYEKNTGESLRQAISLWQQALKFYLPEDRKRQSYKGISFFYWRALTHYRIGLAYQKLRDYRNSLESYSKANTLFSVWDNDVEQEFKAESTKRSRIGRANTRKQIALASEEISQFDQALEFYKSALTLQQDLCKEESSQCDQDEIVSLLLDVSETFYKLGDSESGESYSKQARDLILKLKDEPSKSRHLLRIAVALIDASSQEEDDDIKWKEGFKYLREGLSSLVRYNIMPTSPHTYRILTLRNTILESWSNQQRIDYYLKVVLPFVQKSGDDRELAIAYKDLGEIYIEVDPSQALNYFFKAKELLNKIPSRDIIADIHYGIAVAYSRQKKFEIALEEINQSILNVESIRNGIEDRDLRASYFATVQKHYEAKITIIVELRESKGLNEAASLLFETFNVSEQVRSRTLLGLLDRSRVAVDLKLVEPYQRSEIEKLQLDLNNVEKQLNASDDPETTGKLEQQYVELSRNLNVLTDKIQPKSPIRNSVRTDLPPQVLTDSNKNSKDYSNIYLRALPKNSTLLQYYLGESKSYLFVISHAGDATGLNALQLQRYILPNRREIEAAATSFYDQLKKGGSPQNIAKSGACLRQKILPEGMSGMANKLVISADSILHTIPFSALPLPDTQKRSSDSNLVTEDACGEKARTPENAPSYIPLIAQYEIVNVPSISSIYQIRQRHDQPPTKTLALLADPIFDKSDPRVTKQGTRLLCPNGSNEQVKQTNHSNLGSNSSFESEAALTRSGRGNLRELPCTRTEAEAILAEVREPNQTLSAFDGDANQQWVMTSPLSQYRILHFATHGDSNDKRPELSGLYLSRFNRQGQRLKDDFLRLSEIFNLRLSADLVVLSACQTGLGKNVRGEGTIGLTRGFLSAGAKRVIASLWNVDDPSTARLMASLYHKMLKEGLSPAVALRQTQISMWKSQRNPSEWAAFQFYGEWEK